MKVVLGVTYVTRNAEGEKVSLAPGSIVDMDDRRGAKLIARGQAQRHEEQVVAAAVAEPAGASADASGDRIAAIAKAITLLDPKDREHFDKKGRPRDGAVEAAFGEKVTATEIDAALALIGVGK